MFSWNFKDTLRRECRRERGWPEWLQIPLLVLMFFHKEFIGHIMRKPVFCHMWNTKAQVSQRIHAERLIHPQQTDNLHKVEFVFTIYQRNKRASIVYFSCFYNANAHLILAKQKFVFNTFAACSKNNISVSSMFYWFNYYIFILLFIYKLICKDFRMLCIIRKRFYRWIFRYKYYQLLPLNRYIPHH